MGATSAVLSFFAQALNFSAPRKTLLLFLGSQTRGNRAPMLRSLATAAEHANTSAVAAGYERAFAFEEVDEEASEEPAFYRGAWERCAACSALPPRYRWSLLGKP